jgi:phosphoglucosamine mutase
MNALFGTDGIRGVANTELTPELTFRLGRAAASVLGEGDAPIVVGRDTRVSGSMLEAAIVAGIASAGRNALLLGIVPTPAVACVAREVNAPGVVISASHNPVPDNGIKFFGADGFKLSDRREDHIASALDDTGLARPTGIAVGTIRAAHNLGRHYYHELSAGEPDLSTLHVVVDAGYGAAYAIAPYVIRKLGATVSELHCENDGARINVQCGATDLRLLQAAVRESIEAGRRNTIGVAFDGDADRVLFVDETGAVLSGDHVLYAIGSDMHRRGQLAADTIVATVMSNIGLETALSAKHVALERTAVGDRYVLERMREHGRTLGGEQSGHVIDFRYNTTGDGPRTAVTVLAIVAAAKTTLHELVRDVRVAPQVLVNVQSRNGDVLGNDAIRAEIAAAEEALGRGGRLLVRASGTEPLIRVMAEGEDRTLIEAVTARLAGRIEQEVRRTASP